ncbi:MAG: NYN domain-containing protein [Elusimicrobiota bacterium]|jgi:uncharacterized LabA/DUF88 family protein|nr:NYN domain-containing protein [Elusimicrobiota bacterium]
MSKIRKMFFIDGYNLYHSIDRLSEIDVQFKNCKWLNLLELCCRYVDTAHDIFAGIKYFTALSWKPESRVRQQTYINALLFQCKTEIDVMYGKFKKRSKKCPLCQQDFIYHEEKLTDVNLAISLFENAYKNTFDEAIIISADSDLIPPISAIKSIFADKVIAILPPCDNPANDLINNAHKHYKMKRKTLLNSQLPNTCNQFIRPNKWDSANYKFDNKLKKFIFIQPQ